MTTAPSPEDEAVTARAAPAGVEVDEAPARERSFPLLVGGALLVGFGLRFAIALTDDAPATDATAYLRSGMSIAAGDGFERAGRPELHFPPFVPFLMGMFSKVFSDPHTGAVALTCVASTLLVLPLAFLARRAAGPRAGAITAWVVALVPGLSTTFVATGGGSESVYTLVVITAVALAVAAYGREGWSRLALVAGSGLLVGFAYLTRPEGMFVAVPLLVAVALPAMWRGGGSGGIVARVRSGVVPAAVFLVPLAVCVVPYAMFLHDHTGRWQLSAKTQDVSIEAWRAVADGDREARDKELYQLDETGLSMVDDRTSLPALAREDPSGYAGIVGANVVNLFDTVASPVPGQWWAWDLLPLPLWGLAVLGAWRLRRSRTVALLAAVGAMPVATALVFFVQPRYLVMAIAPAAVLVGIAVASLSPRRRPPVLAATLALLALSSVFAFSGGPGWGHPSDHLSYRRAGEWVAANTDPDERIMARSMVVEFYAERPTVAIPYGTYDEIMAYARHYGVRYLVLDPSTAHRLRPQLKFLLETDTAPGLVLVRHVRAEGQTTRIFALDPAPPPGAPIGDGLGFVGDASG